MSVDQELMNSFGQGFEATPKSVKFYLIKFMEKVIMNIFADNQNLEAYVTKIFTVF